MKTLYKILINASLLAMGPVLGHAAGTYYTGGYQSPQQRYSVGGYNNQTGYATQNRGYVQNGYAAQNRGYAPAANNGTMVRSNATTANRNVSQNNAAQSAPRNTAQQSWSNGLYMNAGLSHEIAHWGFEMKQAGSKLDYNNIGWNVLDINGGYKFNAGNMAMQVDAGFKYGLQFGDSNMIDDDITNGGIKNINYVDTNNNPIGSTYLKSLSVGTSKDGTMMGFYAGFGLTDFFKWGNARITPSIGYRYFKTELETKQNNALSIQTAACFTVPGSDAVECDPAIIVYYNNGQYQLIWREMNADGTIVKVDIADGVDAIDPEDTFAYYLPGTSHKYETTWMGPYIAMDVNYDINTNNSVNGRVELGLPAYTSTGDQPYRVDWAHPKSVEDKAGIGSGWHLGMGANWTTALTNSVSLSLGLTFDYYTISGADAKTYLNPAYFDKLYQLILTNEYNGNEDAMLGKVEGIAGSQDAIDIKALKDSNSWTSSIGSEVDSFYKSLGIRIGINARF